MMVDMTLNKETKQSITFCSLSISVFSSLCEPLTPTVLIEVWHAIKQFIEGNELQ